MDLHVGSDGVLGHGRQPVGNIARWLSSYVLRAELVLSFGRDLAAVLRNSVLSRASRTGAARIRVPPMSDTWLQMHETDYNKHRTEL
jgi:hypothetical protein